MPLTTFKTMTAVRSAVSEGRLVHWKNIRYTLIQDKHGEFLIGCDVGLRGENWVGLTMEHRARDFWAD